MTYLSESIKELIYDTNSDQILTKEQIQLLSNSLDQFVTEVIEKYLKGQKENKNLTEKDLIKILINQLLEKL